MATQTKVQLHRAAQFIEPVLGLKLDSIEGVEMVITAFSLSRRMIEGREVDFSEIHCVPLAEYEKDSDAPTTRYTSWSGPLAERLRQLPQDKLPMIGTFSQSEVSQRGFRSWVLE